MELLLIKGKLQDVIKKVTLEPVTAEWQDKDDQKHATLGLSVEINQLVHIRNCSSAKEVWRVRKSHHQKQTLSGKIFLLKLLCRLTLQEVGVMKNHIIFEIQNKLASLGENLKDHLLAAMLLANFTESISETELTIDFVISKLIDDYRWRKDYFKIIK